MSKNSILFIIVAATMVGILMLQSAYNQENITTYYLLAIVGGSLAWDGLKAILKITTRLIKRRNVKNTNDDEDANYTKEHHEQVCDGFVGVLQLIVILKRYKHGISEEDKKVLTKAEAALLAFLVKQSHIKLKSAPLHTVSQQQIKADGLIPNQRLMIETALPELRNYIAQVPETTIIDKLMYRLSHNPSIKTLTTAFEDLVDHEQEPPK